MHDKENVLERHLISDIHRGYYSRRKKNPGIAFFPDLLGRREIDLLSLGGLFSHFRSCDILKRISLLSI